LSKQENIQLLAPLSVGIPSHVYQFTFASNSEWSRFYATGAEIQEYLKDIAWKYNVEKDVRLRHYFEKAEWNEQTQQWHITLTNLATNKVSGKPVFLCWKNDRELMAWLSLIFVTFF
jgi:cation diffusion facilitator CzcD-associated flavoprotein CzcO